jgi:hypothetical protein
MYNASLCCKKVFVGFWDFVAPRYERLDALDPNQSCLTSSRGILSGVVTALKNCPLRLMGVNRSHLDFSDGHAAWGITAVAFVCDYYGYICQRG